MAFTLDTKFGEMHNDANEVKILDNYAPGISKNPMIGLAKERH